MQLYETEDTTKYVRLHLSVFIIVKYSKSPARPSMCNSLHPINKSTYTSFRFLSSIKPREALRWHEKWENFVHFVAANKVTLS